ncbi:helix-turn-helix domain-containing protein [Leeuwenhoekiella sp. A16]|uniref:helix-turn-helix domain-containing protein n=1 Tax=Leeuwenhoekiella sp. A16 TaxID=3141462 RepID=UPI003A802EAD
MAIKKYKRLNLKERVIIHTLLEENKSKSFISKKLFRSRFCITREIKKWVVKMLSKTYSIFALVDCNNFYASC